MSNQSEIATLIGALGKAGYHVSGAPQDGHTHLQKLRYRNNPDGTIRWLWPAGTHRAGCLKFYHPRTRIQRLISHLLSFLFALGADRLFAHGHLRLYCNHALEFEPGFALYTGVPGSNKITLYSRDAFIKIALNPQSLTLIKNEAAILAHWSSRTFSFLQLPKATHINEHCLLQEELDGRLNRSDTGFDAVRENALRELYCLTGSGTIIRNTAWWTDCINRLIALDLYPDSRIPKGMLRKLSHLADNIPSTKKIPCCRAHGNFTPWTTLPMRGKLGMFDWELSFDKAPAGFDAFHYIIQRGILKHRHPAQVIWQQLESLQNTILARQVGISERRNFLLHLELYLLIQCTSRLDLYSTQMNCHKPITRLIGTWNNLLNFVLLERDGIPPRNSLA